MGALVVYGVFHPNKTMFSKCWASPIQLYTVMNFLAAEKHVCCAALRKCGEEGRRRCTQEQWVWAVPSSIMNTPKSRMESKAHAKMHLSALKWTAKGQLRTQDLKHTLEWVFLSSSLLRETAGEEWCVLVCSVCTGSAHVPWLNHSLLWSGRGMPLN